MGNYVSCTLVGPVAKQSWRGTKVLFLTSKIRSFYKPTKAVELMLKSPIHYVVTARSLQIGRQFSTLNAYKDLEMASAFTMFPMKRLNSVIIAADMGMLLFLAAKKVRESVRILPDHQPINDSSRNQDEDDDQATKLPKLNLDDIEELSTPEFQHRLSMCRLKKSMLETIVEEPMHI